MRGFGKSISSETWISFSAIVRLSDYQIINSHQAIRLSTMTSHQVIKHGSSSLSHLSWIQPCRTGCQRGEMVTQVVSAHLFGCCQTCMRITFWDCSKKVSQVIPTWKVLSRPSEHNHLQDLKIPPFLLPALQPWLLGHQQLASADEWAPRTFPRRERFSSWVAAGWLSAHSCNCLKSPCLSFLFLFLICCQEQHASAFVKRSTLTTILGCSSTGSLSFLCVELSSSLFPIFQSGHQDVFLFSIVCSISLGLKK